MDGSYHEHQEHGQDDGIFCDIISRLFSPWCSKVISHGSYLPWFSRAGTSRQRHDTSELSAASGFALVLAAVSVPVVGRKGAVRYRRHR